jgi:hypothetical protein
MSVRRSQFIDTSTRVARACLTALVSASAIRKYALASIGSGRRSSAAAETLTGSGVESAGRDPDAYAGKSSPGYR